MLQSLARLSKSSTAIILALAVIGVIVMNVVGRIDGQTALDFIKWLVMAFFAKVAVEDGAAKYALGKSLAQNTSLADLDVAAQVLATVAEEAKRERMDTPSRAPTKKLNVTGSGPAEE